MRLIAAAAHPCTAAITGVTLTLIGLPPRDRDPSIAAKLRDAVIDSLITDPAPTPDTGLAARALSLDAALTTAGPTPLRPAETALLRDWLHQLATKP